MCLLGPGWILEIEDSKAETDVQEIWGESPREGYRDKGAGGGTPKAGWQGTGKTDKEELPPAMQFSECFAQANGETSIKCCLLKESHVGQERFGLITGWEQPAGTVGLRVIVHESKCAAGEAVGLPRSCSSSF